MKRQILLLLGSLICIFSMAQSDYRVTASGLNVRVLPSTKGQVIGSLNSNDTVSVFEIENNWAEILYKNKKAYVSAKYLEEVIVLEIPEPQISDTITSDSAEVTNVENKGIKERKRIEFHFTPDWEKWGVDLLPSMAVGISGFLGDYSPIPICAFNIDVNVQAYQKYENKPRGWLSEGSIGYALKGCGGMPINYFTLRLSPAGYIYTLQNEITLLGLCGLSFDFGGGEMYAYYSGKSKTYYAEPFDIGMQLKFAVEWRKFAVAISYDQGFINVIENSSLGLKNFGFNFHFYYRLWDIPHNKIYKP